MIEQWVPLLLFAVLFGLSMDYQVFLLSRIKEAWDRTGDNTLAVTEGIGATAGIITGAALIMVAVFAGFAAGDLVMFQQMGFGLAVAVLLDATLIRTHPGAVGDEAARPLELVPAELARVAAAPEHRGLAAGSGGAAAGRPGRSAGRPRPRAHPGGGARGLTGGSAARSRGRPAGDASSPAGPSVVGGTGASTPPATCYAACGAGLRWQRASPTAGPLPFSSATRPSAAAPLRERERRCAPPIRATAPRTPIAHAQPTA